MRLSIALAVLCLGSISLAETNGSQAAVRMFTNIPPQALGTALQKLAQERKFQIVYAYDDLRDLRTAGAVGELSSKEALTQLLSGTGFTFRYVDDETVTIVPIAPAGGLSTGKERANADIPDKVEEQPADRKRSFWERFHLAQATQGASTGTDSGGNTVVNNNEQAPKSGGTLEEVVVTATKREEKLQDVPFGMSALTTADLERLGATGQSDYLAEVPGVHFTDLGRDRGVAVIRGVASEGTNLDNLQRTVETYLDELPLTDRFSVWTSPDIGTFDIQRVEVLRGPQGTLFGSGALGGAIRMITNKPDLNDYHAKVELGMASTKGGTDSDNFAAMLNLPLIQNQLGLRIVGYRRHDGGYVNNITRNQQDVNDSTDEGGRILLQYNPTEALKMLATVLYERDSANDSSASFINSTYGPANEWDGIIPENGHSKLNIYSFTADYDFGPADLTSITTFSTRDAFLSTDFIRTVDAIAGTGTDPYNNKAFIEWPSRRFAQEIRLASPSGKKLEWTVGGFFMNFKQAPFQIWNLDIGLPTHAIALEDQIHVKTNERAVFGEATYHITSQISATAGARWFSDSFGIDSTYAPDSVVQGNVPWTEIHESSTTPKFSISYYPVDNAHLYFTAAKGYRIGQVNFSANVSPLIPKGYAPDSLWNYELGLKANWLDNRLETNIAAYHIDWTGIQLQRFITVNNIPQNYTSNGGTARINGVEAEIVARPVREFEFGSSLNYNDATLVSVLAGVPLTPGSQLPASPKYSIANYVQGTDYFKTDLSGYVRLDHRYVSKIYSNITNIPEEESDTYNVFNLRAGVNFERYELAVFCNNLTNNDAAASRQISYGGIPGYAAFRLRPRTIGVTIRADF